MMNTHLIQAGFIINGKLLRRMMRNYQVIMNYHGLVLV